MLMLPVIVTQPLRKGNSLFSNINLNVNAGNPSSVYDSVTWVSPKKLLHSLIKTGDTIGKKNCPFEWVQLKQKNVFMAFHPSKWL